LRAMIKGVGIGVATSVTIGVALWWLGKGETK
jgi:hypothetical protein